MNDYPLKNKMKNEYLAIFGGKIVFLCFGI